MATRQDRFPAWRSSRWRVVCFARLIAHPAALIVDGERPSIDHANPGEPRGIGNDVTFFFLPHHLSIARVIRDVRPPAPVGRSGLRRPAAGRQPSGGHVLSARLGGLVVGSPAMLGWLTVASSALGRNRNLCADAIVPARAMGGDGRRGGLPGLAIPSGPHIRGTLSARLGGLLVSVGFLGITASTPGQARGRLALARRSRSHVL